MMLAVGLVIVPLAGGCSDAHNVPDTSTGKYTTVTTAPLYQPPALDANAPPITGLPAAPAGPAGSYPQYGPATAHVTVTGTAPYEADLAQSDGCRGGAPVYSNVINVNARAPDGAVLHFLVTNPHRGTVPVTDPDSTLDGVALSWPGGAIGQPIAGTVTFDNDLATSGRLDADVDAAVGTTAHVIILWNCS